MNVEQALEKYCEHFKVNGFPFFAFTHLSDEEQAALMLKAIEENKEIKPQYNPEYDY